MPFFVVFGVWLLKLKRKHNRFVQLLTLGEHCDAVKQPVLICQGARVKAVVS